jgi:hypothetical protein
MNSVDLKLAQQNPFHMWWWEKHFGHYSWKRMNWGIWSPYMIIMSEIEDVFAGSVNVFNHFNLHRGSEKYNFDLRSCAIQSYHKWFERSVFGSALEEWLWSQVVNFLYQLYVIPSLTPPGFCRLYLTFWDHEWFWSSLIELWNESFWRKCWSSERSHGHLLNAHWQG